MARIPASLDRLIKEFSRMPGVGPRTAERFAYYILKSSGADARRLAAAIEEVKGKVSFCQTCSNLSEQELCEVCADTSRDPSLLCVVEEPRDAAAVENTSEFRGRYHVLLGVLSPLEGIGPQDLKIKELLERIRRDGSIKEVILATGADKEGEATALYLLKLLKPLSVKITRIAYGIPVGGNLEYVDSATLKKALAGRKELS